jgi:hypothetical protein
MSPKDFIPWIGKESTFSRWKRLEKKAATLPVLFALFFSKAIEITVLNITELTRGVMIDIGSMFMLAVITALIYVYEIELEDIGDVVSQE